MTTELTDLLSTLAERRGFLRHTANGLTDEQASSTPTVSELCIGGLIKHVTATERRWIKFVQEGPSSMPPFSEEMIAVHAQQFRMLEGETLAGLLDDYSAAAKETEAVVSSLDNLDDGHPLPDRPWFEKQSWSARRVLLHLIGETSQHAGHADIIRETIDGQKTMG